MFLETNSTLFKSICDPSSVVIQVSTSTDSKISNGIHKINRKETNPTYKSEQITTTNKPNPNSVPTKNSVFLVGHSTVKYLTGQGISKKNHIKIKTILVQELNTLLIISSQVLGRHQIFCLLIREQMTWLMG